ncbi:TolC family protein [Natranaerobius thermophilus]|uniref:Outer membrane protein-like protein n=1 Tax=Natranaerobius thermophilus (strain ATCC BAA-1301 / DSM 18059 / JW/NM-WN-LF) TaxID=457570 RepID=B2A6I3_NATTJ|nr:TolC family protein [Natranaerobius thermophilus]ACB85516.1 Outer membrane protein-like protein [Natranaerobius thermophilus JW/NM-WN-LF]
MNYKTLICVLVMMMVVSLTTVNTTATEDSDDDNKEVVELTLEKARRRIVEHSREADRARLGLEELNIAVERLRDELDELEEGIEELEDGDFDLDGFSDDIDGEVQDNDYALKMETESSNRNLLAQNSSVNLDDDPEIPFEPPNGDEPELPIPEEEIEEIIEEAIQDAIEEMVSDMEEMLEDMASEIFQEMMDEELEDMEKAKKELEQALEEAEQGEELAEMEWEANKEVMKFGAESTYIGLLSLEEQIAAIEESISTFERLLEEERQQLELGESLPVQVEMVELEKNEMENALKSLKENKREMEKEFLDTLGYSTDKELKLAEVNFDLESFQQELDLETFTQRALEEGEEIKIAEKQLEYAEDNLDWARQQDDISESDYREREVALREAELDLEEAERTLEKSIFEAYNGFNESLRDYKNADQRLKLQKELLRGEELSQDLGMATSKQVLDTMVEVEEARRNLNQQEYQNYLAKRELQLLKQGYLVDIPTGAGEQRNFGGETPAMSPDMNEQGMEPSGGGQQPAGPEGQSPR